MATTRGARPFYAKLHNQVIIAIAAAIILGGVWPDAAVKLKPLGDGFIKLLSMMIAPIVFCIIVSGISGMGKAGRVARTAGKSLVYFYAVSGLALLLGLVAANLIPTGTGLNADPRSIDTSSIAGYVTAAKDQGVVPFLLNITPVTLVDAFAKGAILQVILVAVLFGLALIVVGDRASAVKGLVDQLTAVVFAIVEMIVALSPLGAFGAMAFTVGRFGLHSLLPLLAGLALLLGIDPFMQRGRGVTNYIGNGIAAIAIAAWERDLDVGELNRRLDLGPDAQLTPAPSVPASRP